MTSLRFSPKKPLKVSNIILFFMWRGKKIRLDFETFEYLNGWNFSSKIIFCFYFGHIQGKKLIKDGPKVQTLCISKLSFSKVLKVLFLFPWVQLVVKIFSWIWHYLCEVRAQNLSKLAHFIDAKLVQSIYNRLLYK